MIFDPDYNRYVITMPELDQLYQFHSGDAAVKTYLQDIAKQDDFIIDTIAVGQLNLAREIGHVLVDYSADLFSDYLINPAPTTKDRMEPIFQLKTGMEAFLESGKEFIDAGGELPKKDTAVDLEETRVLSAKELIKLVNAYWSNSVYAFSIATNIAYNTEADQDVDINLEAEGFINRTVRFNEGEDLEEPETLQYDAITDIIRDIGTDDDVKVVSTGENLLLTKFVPRLDMLQFEATEPTRRIQASHRTTSLLKAAFGEQLVDDAIMHSIDFSVPGDISSI